MNLFSRLFRRKPKPAPSARDRRFARTVNAPRCDWGTGRQDPMLDPLNPVSPFNPVNQAQTDYCTKASGESHSGGDSSSCSSDSSSSSSSYSD